MLPDETLHHHEAAGISKPEQREIVGPSPEVRPVEKYKHMYRYTYERPPKPPTFWNSYTRTLILDTIMKLSGTIGVTQKTMTLDTHVRLILLQTMTISATSFRGCNRFSPLLISILCIRILAHITCRLVG